MMRKKFDKKTYGQRWQVETVMSMIKRNQVDELRSKTYWAQNREMMLKVLTTTWEYPMSTKSFLSNTDTFIEKAKDIVVAGAFQFLRKSDGAGVVSKIS